MRIKRVLGKDKVRKRPLVELPHKADAIEKRATSTAHCATSSDEVIPIPGVTEVSGYWDERMTNKFTRPEAYIKRVDDEVSYTLTRRSANYDMDDEDEEWLSKFNSAGSKKIGSGFVSVSYETFELIIDAFEKVFFCCPDEFNKKNGQVPLGSLCSDLCSEYVAAAVYGYWLKKRKRRKSALIRVFEVHKVKKRRGRKKKQREGQPRTDSKPVASEYALDENDVTKMAEAEEAARRLGDLAIKKRNKAQLIMTHVDFLMYKATMALRIAGEVRIRESTDKNFSK